MIEVKVENIVASTAFADKLDLEAIMRSVEGAEYEPEQFPGLVYKLSDPKTATLLFKSGKANCTGAKNIEDVHKSLDIIAETLRKLGVNVYKNFEVTVQNMVAVGDLRGEVNLVKAAISLGLGNVEYEPEQFPGLIYKLKEPKVTLLIFNTGKVVVAGSRSTEDISEAMAILSKELDSLGLLQCNGTVIVCGH